MAQQTWPAITKTPPVLVAPGTGVRVRSALEPAQISYPQGLADGSAPGSIVALSPADGSLLSADAETARFTPIAATLTLQVGQVPYVYATIGTLKWLVYDGDAAAFVPFFAEHSTAQQVGTTLTGQPIWNFTVLPNGGWWRSGFDIEFLSGAELE